MQKTVDEYATRVHRNREWRDASMKDVSHSEEDVAPAVEAASKLAADVKTAVPMLDFARQYAEIGSELLAAAEQVFVSQRFILGEQVSQFEQAAARHTH